MRTIATDPGRLSLLLITTLAALPAHAGWTLQANGLGQDSGYIQVSAADADHAMAVGVRSSGTGNSEAVVAITTNGGASWQVARPQTDSTSPIEFYTSIELLTPQRALVGGIGKLLFTTDGGASWTTYAESNWGFFRGPTIADFSFAGPMTGYLVGSGATIRKSSDGGQTWTPVASPVADVDWQGVLSLDADHVWVWAGSSIVDDQTNEVTGYKGGTLARSTDGGATFSVLFEGEARTINQLFMITPSWGWLASTGMAGPRVEQTEDGGETWTQVPLPAGSAGSPDAVIDLFFFDACEGFLLQERSEQSQIMYTTDGGETWTEADREGLKVPLPLPIPIYARLTTFDFPSREVGFAGGFFETLAGYTADAAAPACSIDPGDGTGSNGSGNGTGDGSSDGGGCALATGAAESLPAGGIPWVALGAVLLLLLPRRRWIRYHDPS